LMVYVQLFKKLSKNHGGNFGNQIKVNF